MASLARILNVDVSTISLYENGERLPNVNYLRKFAYLFSVDIKKLIDLTIDATFS